MQGHIEKAEAGMKRRKKAVAAPTDSEDSAPARRLARKPEAENV